jgi:hypothetical protein
LVDFTLKAFLGRISLVGCDHLDESKAARLLGVRITHDVALLDLAVLFEETCDLFLSERGVDASDEEVRARVAALVIIVASSWGRAAACRVNRQSPYMKAE